MIENFPKNYLFPTVIPCHDTGSYGYEDWSNQQGDTVSGHGMTARLRESLFINLIHWNFNH